MPSAGSVFRRPSEEGVYVGPMIEKCGLKGIRFGGAQISEKHAGFIINTGGATANDVLSLIALVQNKVSERFSVRLETEIRIIGE
jgi:UDP-N-acetylmuramate dehydrogenase